MIRRSFIACAVALAVGAGHFAAQAADAIPAAVNAAVADSSRPEADRQRDANRKPAEVIAFAGIEAGDKVADIMPGGGYFTRLFSKVVGPTGTVYGVAPGRAPNAPANAPDFSAAVRRISEEPGYSNVKFADMNEGPPEKVDLVWTSLNYHDFHNRPGADLAAFNRQVFDWLKPGGTYIVIDHAAPAGSGKAHTQTLHRIDPDLVRQEVTAVGFTYVGESKALANPADDRTQGVREDAVRGRTDQFVLRFRKPG
jgi:predicted methyltransferase